MAKCVKFISQNLSAWIKNSGKSQSEIAREVGITPTYINQLVKGTNTNPSLKYLEDICAYFNRTVADILRDPKDSGGHKVRDCLRTVRRLFGELEGAGDSPLLKELLSKD